jgi:molybdopterin-synthase adenylyltransferase
MTANVLNANQPSANRLSLLKTNDRFARHHLIAGFEQSVVSGLRLGLVGAGAIGNEFLKNALLMGVGAIDVYDFDTVELSNLTRSVFLRQTDIGQNKAKAVVARAQELHPQTQLKAIAGDITDTLSLTTVQQYDFLICAVDNLSARLRLNDMALITATDWINLAIDSRHVVVEVMGNKARRSANYVNHACYACGLPNSAWERLQKRYSCGGLQRAAFIEKKIPTTAITASTVAALGISEMLRLAHARQGAGQWHAPPDDDPKRIFLDTISFSTQVSALSKNADCPACGFIDQPKPIVRDITASQQWLSDAIVSNCRCVHCQWQPSPNIWLGQRAKNLADTLIHCPHCHAGSVEVTIIDAVSTQDANWALLANVQTQVSWTTDGVVYWDRHAQQTGAKVE